MMFIGFDLGFGKRIMTRFKTGSKVEVFSTREVPSGSWYLAEIIHGNGHYYTVKYENGEFFQVFDRVPRKAIRPCPPPLQVLDWALGDVVEVFHHFSWKMATVLKALQTGWILVRLLGSSHELEVSEVDARPRVFLHDDEWNVVGKGLNNCEKRHNVHSLLNNHNSPQMETTTSISLKNSYFPCSINNGGTQEVLDGPKPLKRKLKTCYPESGEHAGQNKKVNRRRNKIISTILQPPLPVKKDAVASSRATLVEKCMPPFTNQLAGFSKKSTGWERIGSSLGCSLAISSDSRGANSITSSVASCSMSAVNTCEIPRNFLTEENDDYNSDAESFCPNRSEEGNFLLPADQNLSEEIHRIELHAYRSIIGALYASGPLSWEQETLLTDLRDSLHISNDEHLIELRSLVSSSS